MFFDVLVMLWNSRIEVKSNILIERVVKKLYFSAQLGVKGSIQTERGVKKRNSSELEA